MFIVDESSQVPASLMVLALSMGRKWVIVGDDRQLPGPAAFEVNPLSRVFGGFDALLDHRVSDT